ncbi:efflux RND transporter periplasmic adaptor subunit [Flavimarina sp. Hel_I_48]|uniref:efflux RND transporter periplasmic adaptor subunit n=1 Tax=Flavimarina sp. Hel_I_48 TaxID=1392488 RepID=UPI0004DFB4F8|nr:efflux RND transporter periplasmic adaptor subunit [Flavimarina sp. Hel_I_48]
MKTKYIVYSVLILGLLGLVAYRVIDNKEKDEAGEQGRGNTMVTVGGMILEPQKFEDNLSLSGSLEANEQIDLRSEVNGVVEQINFEEGSEVKKGQVLFRVNDVELRAQQSMMSSAQKLASENERRAKLLLEKQAISQEEYDVSNADLASSKASSQLINAQLSKATVRAPFSGTIGLREISEGTYVTPQTPIAKLVNTSQLKITFAIPEKYASRMKINNEISFTTPTSTEEQTAKIYAIEPAVEIATRTLRMRAVADNSSGKLYPGTFVNVLLPLETIEDALLVPTEALIPIQNGKKIFVYRNGKAREIEVKTGSRTDSLVRVITGLKARDTILTYGVMALNDGTPVKVNLEDKANIAAK